MSSSWWSLRFHCKLYLMEDIERDNAKTLNHGLEVIMIFLKLLNKKVRFNSVLKLSNQFLLFQRRKKKRRPKHQNHNQRKKRKKNQRKILNYFHQQALLFMITRHSLLTTKIKLVLVLMKPIRPLIGKDGLTGSLNMKNMVKKVPFFTVQTTFLVVSYQELNTQQNTLLEDMVFSEMNQILTFMVSGYAEVQKNFQMVSLKNIHNLNTINTDNLTQETTKKTTYWLENSSQRKKKMSLNLLTDKKPKL